MDNVLGLRMILPGKDAHIIQKLMFLHLFIYIFVSLGYFLTHQNNFSTASYKEYYEFHNVHIIYCLSLVCLPLLAKVKGC